jgi:hypothetical protein
MAEEVSAPRDDRWTIAVPVPTRHFLAWLVVQALACLGALGLGAYIYSRLGYSVAEWAFNHHAAFPVQAAAAMVPSLALAALLGTSGVLSGLRRRWWLLPAVCSAGPALISLAVMTFTGLLLQ